MPKVSPAEAQRFAESIVAVNHDVPALQGIGWRSQEEVKYLDYVCTLCIPKTQRIFTVLKGKTNHQVMVVVPASSPPWVVVGQGYYSLSDYPADATGCTRSHTPLGVADFSAGYGLALYGGISLASAMAEGMNCTSSASGDRSESAEKWWNNQVNKYGLAREVAVESKRENCESYQEEFRVPSLRLDTLSRSGQKERKARSKSLKRLSTEARAKGASFPSFASDEWMGREILMSIPHVADYLDEHPEMQITEPDVAYSGVVSFDLCKLGKGTAQVLDAAAIFRLGIVLDWNEKLDSLAAEHGRPMPWEALLAIDISYIYDEAVVAWFVEKLVERGAPEDRVRRFLEENNQVTRYDYGAAPRTRAWLDAFRSNQASAQRAWTNFFGAYSDDE